MRRWIGPVVTALLIAVVAHAAIILAAPSFIMSRAMAMLEERGIMQHAFTLTPRVTPETQRVVRPSPDLAYSICLFDMDDAPDGLDVRMAAYDGYSSLSFFARSTDNFRTIRGRGHARRLTLLPPGMPAKNDAELTAPSTRGIILIRRLAPTPADYARVVATTSADICTPRIMADGMTQIGTRGTARGLTAKNPRKE